MIEARAAPSHPHWMMLIGALLASLTFGPHAAAQLLALKDAPVPGWPPLQIETHYVPRIAMRGICLPVPAGTPIPETTLNGCARPDFWRGVCDVYIDVHYVASTELYELQRKRCRGYDHRNSDAFAEALRVWHERGENRYADVLDFESIMFVWDPVTRCEDGDRACIEMR